MPREYRRYEPDQSLLLPPSLRDWLPEEHLAFFLSDTIDALDLSAFDDRYGEAGPGNQAFDPRMMLRAAGGVGDGNRTRDFQNHNLAL